MEQGRVGEGEGTPQEQLFEGAVGAARRAALPACTGAAPAGSTAPPARPHQRSADALPGSEGAGLGGEAVSLDGRYYYVHTANGREWSQWGAAGRAERRSSPERAAAALFSDEDDDGSASDSEDEMPVSALLARQATANDAAIAQALAGSPPKRSRRITGGVGGRRHGKKRREPVVVPAPAEDDDESSVWSQSSLSDSNPPSPTYEQPPSPTYESVMESGGIDYESGSSTTRTPHRRGRGRGAVKPAWMTRGALDARADDDFRPLGSRAVLAARGAPLERGGLRGTCTNAVSTPRPWRNPRPPRRPRRQAGGRRRAFGQGRPALRPPVKAAATPHVFTPVGRGAVWSQTPRWAPPTAATNWGPRLAVTRRRRSVGRSHHPEGAQPTPRFAAQPGLSPGQAATRRRRPPPRAGARGRASRGPGRPCGSSSVPSQKV